MRFYKEEDEAYRRVTASLHPTSSKVPPNPDGTGLHRKQKAGAGEVKRESTR